MKLINSIKWVLITTVLFFSNAKSQDYLWPTDASRYLTSSFAEYRPGHFHAGIDIKTWGQVGYKVFAVRDGYIMRIRVSPFGYGKVVYQKLDNGEIAIYAHLNHFNEQLEKIVKREQRRRGEYRINKYLESFRYPVKKGDVIGYTGSTGIGHPHLHFELRDAHNNPTNPFLKGFRIDDQIPPRVAAVSITPLDVNSRVNSDVIPWIEKPRLVNHKKYRLPSKPLLSGKVGFAVKCFDKANGVNNTFSVYKLTFYVDGSLKYSATYDKFSYSQSHFIDFDRDYRLRKRGYGLFQNLYKIKHNKLDFYLPFGEEVGILECDPSARNAEHNGIIGKGMHQYKIELRDFFGNTTVVTGEFVVGERKTLTGEFTFTPPNKLFITGLFDGTGEFVHDPEIFVSDNQGASWDSVHPKITFSNVISYATFKLGYEINPVAENDIIKIQAADESGINSHPLYYVVKGSSSPHQSDDEIKLEKDFYNNYIRLKVITPVLLDGEPDLFVRQGESPPVKVPFIKKSISEFVGVYTINPEISGPISIEVYATDLTGRMLSYQEQFDLQTVTPRAGGSIVSDDGNCRLSFKQNKVYENLFLRMNVLEPVDDWRYDAVGNVYEIHPQDELLKGSALLEMRYPPGDSLPEKLGIYTFYKNKWGFVGNNLDTLHHSISCKVSGLNTYTLIRDVVPPVLKIRRPRENARLINRTPTIVAVVYDELSGIPSERSIVMKLDGQKVIAEYDPETKTIKYKSDQPLSAGRHQISIIATDNCKNETKAIQWFTIGQ